MQLKRLFFSAKLVMLRSWELVSMHVSRFPCWPRTVSGNRPESRETTRACHLTSFDPAIDEKIEISLTCFAATAYGYTELWPAGQSVSERTQPESRH